MFNNTLYIIIIIIIIIMRHVKGHTLEYLHAYMIIPYLNLVLFTIKYWDTVSYH